MQGVVPTDPSQSVRVKPPSRPPPAVIVASQLGGSPIDPMAGTLAQPDSARAAVANARPAGPSGQPPLAVVQSPRPSSSAAQWGSAVLVNRDGTDGQRFALTSEDTVIGRAGADIAFDDDRFLARQHARIARGADGTITIHPLDTVNGVFRKADGPTDLADGAIILLGREVLRFERVAAEERTVTPLVRHGVSLFGSPPRDPWGRLLQLVPSGGCRDVRHLVGEEVVLGREEGDIVFRDDAFMSRRHAAMTWDGTRPRITDLGSSNGTFVRIVGPTVIKTGDHVRLGDQLLRIER
jgi:pSer/pThr/pTyr-binding forkhead associated (FHA) protein